MFLNPLIPQFLKSEKLVGDFSAFENFSFHGIGAGIPTLFAKGAMANLNPVEMRTCFVVLREKWPVLYHNE